MVVIIVIRVTAGSDQEDWNKLGICSESLHDLSPVTERGVLSWEGESLNLGRVLEGSSGKFGGHCVFGTHIDEGRVLVAVRSFEG